MEKTWKPTTAGILAIIAGIIGIVTGGITIGGGALYGLGTPFGFGTFPGGLGMFPGFFAGAVIAWGVAQIIFGIIAITGGNHARKRRSWGRALAGAILAIPIAPPLGILAVICLAMGKNEFSQ